MRKARCVAAVLGLMCLSTVAVVADNPAQVHLLARRAAVADAQRQLAETIYGVQVDAHTTVRDFATQDDTIRTDLEACLRAATVVDERSLPDGSVQVDMEVPVSTLPGKIRHYLEPLGPVIRATGSGAPPSGESASAPPDMPPPASERTIRATGRGVAPSGMSETQAKLSAERAAETDARRNLAEEIQGVDLDSSTKVSDFVAENDEVRTRLSGFLQGARVVERRQLEDGVTEVEIEMPLAGLDDAIGYHEGGGPAGARPGASLDAPVGMDPQARLMAQRAAQADAYRNLAEMVYGVHVDSQTTVRNFVTEDDTVRTQVQAWLKGARATDTQYHADGSCTVEMEAYTRTLPGNVRKVVEKAYGPLLRVSGSGVAPR